MARNREQNTLSCEEAILAAGQWQSQDIAKPENPKLAHMSSSKQPKRRSLRLLGEPAPEEPLLKRGYKYKRGQPRKRARSCSTSDSTPMSGGDLIESNRKATILSLPDEPIQLIFSFLTVSDTGSTLRRPRDAICLAVTNTRLFRLFGQQLTSITPTTWKEPPAALTYRHWRSLIRFSGKSLRELRFLSREWGFPIAPIIRSLPTQCPRLEKLAIVDDHLHDGLHSISQLVDLSLRSLSISDPTLVTLHSLVRVPEELCLTDVQTDFDYGKALIPVLRLLPKKLYLQLHDIHVPRDILACLHQVCPKIEEVTVKLKYHEFGHSARLEHYRPTATRSLLEWSRDENSICRKMTLCGLTDLVQHTHPKAIVEVSEAFQIYGYNGIEDELYVKALPLWDWFLLEDVSNLKEISVAYVDGSVHIHPLWKLLLADKRFSRVWVESAEDMGGLRINADVVEVPVDCMTCSNWQWLGDVKEVRILEWFPDGQTPEVRAFFRGMASLLESFRGVLVWMEYTRIFSLDKNAALDNGLFEDLVSALNEFEERGGDAGTVRTMLEFLQWR